MIQTLETCQHAQEKRRKELLGRQRSKARERNSTTQQEGEEAQSERRGQLQDSVREAEEEPLGEDRSKRGRGWGRARQATERQEEEEEQQQQKEWEEKKEALAQARAKWSEQARKQQNWEWKWEQEASVEKEALIRFQQQQDQLLPHHRSQLQPQLEEESKGSEHDQVCLDTF